MTLLLISETMLKKHEHRNIYYALEVTHLYSIGFFVGVCHLSYIVVYLGRIRMQERDKGENEKL